MYNNNIVIVGKFREDYNKALGLDFPILDIVQSAGLCKHIEKHHPKIIGYINCISAILSAPDYIGTNPNVPDSIELVKRYEDNILLAIKLDISNERYYIASLYDITSAKLEKNISSGRLRIFGDINNSD